MFQFGKKTFKQDYSKARRSQWFLKAAENGGVYCCGGQSRCRCINLVTGRSARLSKGKRRWYSKRRPNKGVPHLSKTSLAACSKMATAVQQDCTEAMEWHQKAAEKGQAKCMDQHWLLVPKWLRRFNKTVWKQWSGIKWRLRKGRLNVWINIGDMVRFRFRIRCSGRQVQGNGGGIYRSVESATCIRARPRRPEGLLEGG